jgi:hypothetical protein
MKNFEYREMKRIINYTLILFLGLFYSCQPENHPCFKSNGEHSESIITLESFNEIIIEDMIFVELKQDADFKLILNGGENLFPFIQYELEDSRLYLRDENRCRWLRSNEPLIVTICFPEIGKLIITDSGVVTCYDTLKLDKIEIENRAGLCDMSLNLDCDSLWFRTHAGTGDFDLKGMSKYAYLYNIGTGHLHAELLETDVIHLVHRSTGDISVNVDKLLMVEDLRHGKLYYYGCPDMVSADTSFEPLMIDMGCSE